MQRYIIIAFLTFSFLIGNEADHIIFSQITIASDEAEVIAIHNPTDDSINLSKFSESLICSASTSSESLKN